MENIKKFIKLSLVVSVLGSSLSWPALADDAADINKALQQEKDRLTLEADIEDLKSKIVKNKLAQIPESSADPLQGTVNIEQLGTAGLVVAVDLAKKLATNLCKSIDAGKSVTIYDSTTISGVISAIQLNKQITNFDNEMKNILDGMKEDGKPVGPKDLEPQFRIRGIPQIAAAATGTLKSIADLTSLFKSNVTFTNTQFAEAKSLLLTAMASTEGCNKKIIDLGFGYIGEYETTEFEGLLDRIKELLIKKSKIDAKIVDLKKELATATDQIKKLKIQANIDLLSSTSSVANDFITALKMNEIGNPSPLFVAAKYLSLSKRLNNSNSSTQIMDIDIKLEGLSIVKDNFFTGQKLRLSAAAIVWYRLHNMDGSIVKADVWRELAKPVQVDLGGFNPDDTFWSK